MNVIQLVYHDENYEKVRNEDCVCIALLEWSTVDHSSNEYQFLEFKASAGPKVLISLL